MNKSITILEKDYKQWLKELSSRYRRSQIKAAVKVNEEMLRFYWELGRDIVERDAENKYGHKFYATLSNDLKVALSEECAISPFTIRYTKRFYLLYCQCVENLQQLAEKLEGKNIQQLAEKSDKQFAPKLGAIITGDIFSIPWGHHPYPSQRGSRQPHHWVADMQRERPNTSTIRFGVE